MQGVSDSRQWRDESETIHCIDVTLSVRVASECDISDDTRQRVDCHFADDLCDFFARLFLSVPSSNTQPVVDQHFHDQPSDDYCASVRLTSEGAERGAHGRKQRTGVIDEGETGGGTEVRVARESDGGRTAIEGVESQFGEGRGEGAIERVRKYTRE